MNTLPQYINFVRKYRPSNFHELLGQEALVKIINYSILNNRLCQAYLLTGIRGVGKTSSARLIAKVVNCTNIIIESNTAISCNNCENCINFVGHRHPDVIEIDAASKTGVDDIREVIESSEYKPLLGKYKIFIIDEVHMLSKSAFNALLKILEEPPAHVIFIFATTEVQKIPATIISRCQKYDLRRLTFIEITQLLEKIVLAEKLNFDPAAIKLIAIKSEGSARDAVRLLDQAGTINSNNPNESISLLSVNQMIGSVDLSYTIDLLRFIIGQDGIKAIELVNKAYGLSSNIENFLQDITHFIAHLSKMKILINYQDPLYVGYVNEISDILINVNLSRLTVLWQIFNQGLIEVKVSHNQLIALEMIIIKAIYSFSFPEAESLVNFSDKIEESSSVLKENPSARNVIQKPLKQKIGIIGFLDFLHSSNEIEIYYFLLNYAEIKKFESETIELICEAISNTLKENLKNLLLKWTGQEWNVIVVKQAGYISLKEQLVNQVQTGEDWELIKKHFPSAKISALLLSN